MRVCGLALILVRRVSEESMNVLKEASKAARKPSRRNNELDLQDRATARADDQEGLDDGFEAAGSAEGAEGPGGLTRAPRPAQPGERRMLGDAPLPAGVAGATGGKALSPGEDRTDTEGVGGAVAAGTVGANGEAAVGMLNPRVQNVVAQLSALLSFKEAFCTGRFQQRFLYYFLIVYLPFGFVFTFYFADKASSIDVVFQCLSEFILIIFLLAFVSVAAWWFNRGVQCRNHECVPRVLGEGKGADNGRQQDTGRNMLLLSKVRCDRITGYVKHDNVIHMTFADERWLCMGGV